MKKVPLNELTKLSHIFYRLSPLKAPVVFPTQSCDPISCYGKP